MMNQFIIKFKKIKSFTKFKIRPIKYFFEKQKSKNSYRGISDKNKKIKYL